MVQLHRDHDTKKDKKQCKSKLYFSKNLIEIENGSHNKRSKCSPLPMMHASHQRHMESRKHYIWPCTLTKESRNQNSPDFYLWRYLKFLVYETLLSLAICLIAGIAEVAAHVLESLSQLETA